MESFQVDCRLYLNQVPSPVAIIDDSLLVRYGNQPFLKMCQLERAEELPLLDVVEQFCIDRVNLQVFGEFINEALRELPGSGTFVARCLETHRVTITLLTPSPGRLFLLQFDSIVTPVETGYNDERVADLMELVQRQRTEISIQAQRYAEIFDYTAEAILLFVRDNGNWVLNDTNQAARNMLLGDQAALLRRPLQELLPADIVTRIEQQTTEGELNTRGLHVDSIVRIDQQTQLPVEVHARLLELSEGTVLQLHLQGVADRQLMELKLQRRVRELSILHEISSVLLESRDLEHVYHIVLTGVTFGQGLGFNRAFLLFYDEDSLRLTGRTAVGPATRDEADQIWNDLNRHDMNLQSILHSYQEMSILRNDTINNLVQRISIQLEDRDSQVYRAFRDNHYGVLQRDEVTATEDLELLNYLGAKTCWITPIISFKEDQPQWRGALVVDNFITGRVPQREDIEALEICGHNLAITMERFDLVGELQIKIHNLEELYQKYRESSQKLLFAEKLAAMGKVATRIAHEIKNPLVSIGGFALKLKNAIPPSDKLHRYASIVVDEVRRLEETLYSVLYFSNLRQTVPTPFSIPELVHYCKELFVDVLERANIKLVIKLAPEVGTITADKGQLEQVLINLLRNAIEAIDHEGCITLQVVADDDNYYFTVADDGPGLSTEEDEMPFESFFSTKATGTGLGLTITREIIDNHGGGISLTNRNEGGAQANFFLPQRSGSDT